MVVVEVVPYLLIELRKKSAPPNVDERNNTHAQTQTPLHTHTHTHARTHEQTDTHAYSKFAN